MTENLQLVYSMYKHVSEETSLVILWSFNVNWNGTTKL